MIHVVLGTRAQLIKMAPVIRELERRRQPFRLTLTGQHRVTMQELLDDFRIRATPETLYDGREVGGIGHMAVWLVRCLWRLVRQRERWFPVRDRSIIVVHGDTASTLLGALAGKLLGLTVAHIEAGLRSYRWFHPFPEELTRLAVFRLVDIAYCPGPWACRNMAGYRLRVVDTGENTLLDAVRWALRSGRSAATPEPYFVASIHRFENVYFAKRFRLILSILGRLARRARCVFVLHPVTEQRLRRLGWLESLAADRSYELRPRMRYSEFIALLSGARFVVTDGGSNQEELSYLDVPTVLMRDTTERQEGVGQTAFVSRYDGAAIERFLDAAPARGPAPLEDRPRPSELIVDDLAAQLRR
jgi:UDP-N-acetylglucosamine 2-epimerase (non-hydrolysing)